MLILNLSDALSGRSIKLLINRVGVGVHLNVLPSSRTTRPASARCRLLATADNGFCELVGARPFLPEPTRARRPQPAVTG